MGIIKKDFIKLTNSMMSLNSNKSKKIFFTLFFLVVCGEKDRANKKATKNLAENITKVEIQFVKNATHEVNIDATKEL